MNLAVIQTFLAIADSGQMNRAAELLHVTQSTVTTESRSCSVRPPTRTAFAPRALRGRA